MYRFADLLFICSIFLHYSTCTNLKPDLCQKPVWFRCHNGECISNILVCDDKDDCGDNSDEKDCKEYTPTWVNKCTTYEFQCSNKHCIPAKKFCDAIPDCSDKSDEYIGCVNDLKCDNDFRCHDKHCVTIEWVCDGMPDCPDGSDEWDCDNRTFSANDCKSESNRYLCKNQRCISLNNVCNEKDDCGDGSDEGVDCKNTTLCLEEKCSHTCKVTPVGPVCVCQPGYKLQNSNHTCEDINECEIFGICDQGCVNTPGSYTCNCQNNYALQDDKKTCKASGGEAAIVFSTKTEICMLFLNSRKYFVAAKDLNFALSVAINGDYLYWSEHEDGHDIIVKSNFTRRKQTIVSTGLDSVTDIAVDWITNNIYFVDEGHRHIGVCNNNGTYCTILIINISDEAKGFALLPSKGVMYVCFWKPVPSIVMGGMDGEKFRLFITKDLKWPNTPIIDYSNNRLYWSDAKKPLIESIRLDGTDRRIILQQIPTHIFSMAIFEDKLYWVDQIEDTINYCNKFSGKNWTILQKTSDVPYSLHIDHSAIKPKFLNPCHKNPCSQLCMLNENKNYTCACTLDEELMPDKHTCRDTKKSQYIIIAVNGLFINYYHELLGRPKLTANFGLRHITAMTYNSLSGTVLVSDQFANNIFQYNPITGNITTFISIKNKVVGGLAYDHIGNNLYLSNLEQHTIEVHSLTTKAETIFYYRERPVNIALIPEKGLMFVAFEYKEKYWIEKIQMDGLGPRILIKNDLRGAVVSLCYDADKETLFWSDEFSGRIGSFKLTDDNHYLFRTGIDRPVNLAVAGDYLFWTQRRSQKLFWTDKNNILQGYDSLNLKMSKNVNIMHLASLHDIIVHEEGCSENNGYCSHVCLSSNPTSYICACPPEMTLSTDNRTCIPQPMCSHGEIKCGEHYICIMREHWCDGIKHCPNGEDESNCKKNVDICGVYEFMCNNGMCITKSQRCNLYPDCTDKSDEEGCPKRNCTTDHLKYEFQCNDGHCINYFAVCDGSFDCPDFSDEENCDAHTCPPDTFACKMGICIPSSWRCDDYPFCPDASDETKCQKSCDDDDVFTCDNGICISDILRCNDADDCGDNSDEKDCDEMSQMDYEEEDYYHSNCSDNEYVCYNTDICIPSTARCDGISNCPKNDDEHNCAFCLENEFICNNRKCIPQIWVCDTDNDCGDESDEKECDSNKRIAKFNSSIKCTEFKCSNGHCLPFRKVCNDIWDCTDGSDEEGKCTTACIQDDICQGTCYKTPHGEICGCSKGYHLATDMVSCEDVNECEYDICSQICQNTNGSFECMCHDGYFISDDRVSCKARGPQVKFIIVINNDIKMTSFNFYKTELIQSLNFSINGLDANARDNTIYWSSDESSTINRLNLKTKEREVITDVGNPGVLAIDWITDNIYFADNERPNMIKVCNMNRKKCATVLKIEGEARVTSLVVNPENGWLFWGQSTWSLNDSPFSEICRTNMGFNTKIILSQNIGVVSGMTIDHTKSKLYWSDKFYKIIESSNFDGSERRILFKTGYQPLTINIYANLLYIMTNLSRLHTCQLYGEKMCVGYEMDVHNMHKHFTILQISRQPVGIYTEYPCNKLNCSHMCVLKDNSMACICQDGKQIEPNNTCPTNNEISFDKNGTYTSKKFYVSKIGLLIMIIILCFLIIYRICRKELKKDEPNHQTDSFSLSSTRLQNLLDREVSNILDSLETAVINLSLEEHESEYDTNPSTTEKLPTVEDSIASTRNCSDGEDKTEESLISLL